MNRHPRRQSSDPELQSVVRLPREIQFKQVGAAWLKEEKVGKGGIMEKSESRPDGRCPARGVVLATTSCRSGERKVRAPQDTVVGNAHRPNLAFLVMHGEAGEGQGKCNRKIPPGESRQ